MTEGGHGELPVFRPGNGFIHSTNIYRVLDTVLGIKDIALSKTDDCPDGSYGG